MRIYLIYADLHPLYSCTELHILVCKLKMKLWQISNFRMKTERWAGVWLWNCGICDEADGVRGQERWDRGGSASITEIRQCQLLSFICRRSEQEPEWRLAMYDGDYPHGDIGPLPSVAASTPAEARHQASVALSSEGRASDQNTVGISFNWTYTSSRLQ